MILYRTPDIIIDEFEFHISIEIRDGRVRKFTRWRLVSPKKRLAWQPIAEFKGHLPKVGIWKSRFGPYKRHMEMAERSIEAKRVETRRLAERQAKLAA